MSDFSKAIATLEYNKILDLLASCCHTEGSKAEAMRLRPTSDVKRVKMLMAQTSDAKALASIKGSPSFGSVKDINPSLERADKGAQLNPRELLDIADVLRVSRTLIDYINVDNKQPTSLDEIFDRLSANRFLEEKIYRTVISEDMIADEASPALADIRRKKRNTANRIKDILQRYTTGEHTKYLQENIITQRAGRYVVPVKAEYRSEIKGLTHDTSASGATLFIEPMAVVEANNELRVLESKEKHEIDRILSELSANCAEHAASTSLNYYNITVLAFIFARAELSFKMDASAPVISEDKYALDLAHARHPLLDRKTVVPISVRLGGDFDTLVITGPNTGGKTVTLKTIGLLSMMCQSGLHIPADDLSVMPVFEDILADIGDEQSIEQSLSTFSAHMTNIVSILDECGEGSLVLFDELGAGTDPVEGAALAEAILENARMKGALCAATTHYAELKEYALNTDGVSNASCEFDVETLRPTYKLIIGTPGRSNAFAISERLGLSEKVIERAKQLINTDSRRFEDTIDRLEAARIEMEAQRDEARRLRREFEDFKQRKEKEINAKNEKAEKEIEKSRVKATQMLESARVSSDYIFSQLAELKKVRDSGKYSSSIDSTRDDIRQRLRQMGDEVNPVDEKVVKNYKPPRPYKKGDSVVIVNIGQNGTLLDAPDKNGDVMVMAGLIKMKTNVKNLMLDEESKDKKKDQKKTVQSGESFRRTVRADFSNELDLRGKNGEEAFIAIDKYLDEAKLVNLTTVRLVHGKGTGALRKAVQEYLRTDFRVKSYRLGQYGEGDSGVTVVELK